MAAADGEAVATFFESGSLDGLLADPLFLAALEHCLLPWRDSEAVASSLRLVPLAGLAAGRPLSEDALTWIVPLALQAYNAGHVDTTREEERDRLRGRMRRRGTPVARWSRCATSRARCTRRSMSAAGPSGP